MSVHHHHEQHAQNFGKAFAIGIVLNLAFVVVEVIYGFMANSSALLADGGHNASDVLSLLFAWVATALAAKRPFGKYTYGLRRTTILVSLFNALLIFGAVIAIGWEAIVKLQHPTPIPGKTIMIVAAIGIVINAVTALMFMKGKKEDLNIKGAYLHMMADALVSVGVLIAGLIIYLTDMYWIDPVISFIIIIVIIASTWRLFTDSFNLALDAVPRDIDLQDVRNFLLSCDGVENVHDLHIWAMSTTQNALTTHLVVPGDSSDEFIFRIRRKLKDKYHIEHTTIQIEREFAPEGVKQDCNEC